MLQCPPQCPTVRRQLREEIKRAGWTDEYIQSVVDKHQRARSVDTTQDSEAGLSRKVKPDSRKKPLDHVKRGRQELAIDHADRYERERRKDHFESPARDVKRVINYEDSIDDSDEIKDEFEEPVASLVQESIYYTEKKQIARVAPLKRVTPKVSPQSSRSIPSKIPRARTSKTQTREIGSPIEDKERIVYGRGEVADTAVAYRRELHHKVVPVQDIPDRKEADYKIESHDVTYRGTPDRKVFDHKTIDREMPGPSRIVEDRKTVKSRDDSPDNYYKYIPKELPSDWPHDGCDETCPANILKERAEQLREKSSQMDDRYSTTSQDNFKGVCTCSLSCMMHSLKKDPFVRSILTSAMLFAIGIKLCSELHGWYLPIRA